MLGWGVLVVTFKSTPLVLAKPAAVRAALADPATARLLAPLHWESIFDAMNEEFFESLAEMPEHEKSTFSNRLRSGVDHAVHSWGREEAERLFGGILI